MRYARNTEVSSDRSRAEIERVLIKYGASKFAYGWQEKDAIIAFEFEKRHIRFKLPLPDKNSKEFIMTPSGRKERGKEDAYKVWEQSCKQRWRALLLIIKAKFEAAEDGITTIETEFLPYTVLPNGQTMSEYVLPKINKLLSNDEMPKLMILGDK
jgi:hypothetical protein